MAFTFAVVAGVTAQRALSGDLDSVAVPVGFAAVTVPAPRIRTATVGARTGVGEDANAE